MNDSGGFTHKDDKSTLVGISAYATIQTTPDAMIPQGNTDDMVAS